MSGYTRPIKFFLGRVFLLKRHREDDYGAEMAYDDRVVNEESIKRGGRVLSHYTLRDGTVLSVITEAGWQETTCKVREEGQ